MKHAIGIDLGGTKINAGVIRQDGVIVTSQRYETPLEGSGEDILKAIVSAVRTLQADFGALPVGVGSPGLIEYPSGVILGCTPNLPDWQGRSLKQYLENALQVPVQVDNDANAATWGEFRAGAAQGFHHLVMLTLGTGLGSGMIVNGQVLRGFHGLGIGFGHMIVEQSGRFCNCGQQGCLEAYVSGKGLARSYQLRGGDLAVKGPEIFDRAARQEPLAQAAVNEFIHMLGVGVTNILNTLAPEALLIGGGISAQGEERLFAPLRTKVAALMSMPLHHPPMIRAAALGPDAGLIGAGFLAIDYLNE